MLLFHESNVQPILRGIKTQTRRCWLNQRVKVGNEYWAQTSRRADSRFAKIKVVSVKVWKVQDGISAEDVKKEGFRTESDFWEFWFGANDEKMKDPRRVDYIIDFEVTQWLK